MMTAGRICTREVDIVSPGDSVRAAAFRMLERNVGSLIVVDETQAPIGVVTDRDLAIRALTQPVDSSTVTIKDVMTSEPQVVSEDTPIEDVLRVMRLGPHRRLPVVNKERMLVGVISLDDILDLLSEEFFSIGSLLRKETFKGTRTAPYIERL